jgi:hypothetical protein
MSTFTVELPETLNRQIRGKGISQKQLETLFFRVLQIYLGAPPPTGTNTDGSSSRPPTTLPDLRGSIPVATPQDFHAIRQQVISTHIRQRVSHGS